MDWKWVCVYVWTNLMPIACNSPEPPPLFNIPINSRKRTGSLQRSRNVDMASETAVWPACANLWLPWWPKDCLSQAVVISCRARIRARMPWPVAEEAKGIRPTEVVPRRTAASMDREQQMLKHCLRESGMNEWFLFWRRGSLVYRLTDKPIHPAEPFSDSSGSCVWAWYWYHCCSSGLVHLWLERVEWNVELPTGDWLHRRVTSQTPVQNYDMNSRDKDKNNNYNKNIEEFYTKISFPLPLLFLWRISIHLL